ncbi:hypothetical protein HYH03_010654 [Edaphochlamys debaryana]|uniref:Thioredoxin domain-containing protein n=1 Tax=Edaphochlamys debaryana TaxID=47281 RepID=A0A835XVL6_9CHLO|nr:hypothetical protein HYH03_010654 [Edaphochlamys debaryana]|eukprot:KAG2490981.1 hypothetical protein HYH03_010654 [Edaphochlamys debaryana]
MMLSRQLTSHTPAAGRKTVALAPRASRPIRAVTARVLERAVSDAIGVSSTGSAQSYADDDSDEEEEPRPLRWWEKPCSFKEIKSLAEFEAALSPANNGGKMTVVDFYAGWCACCKSSFVHLCRIPSNKFLAENYNFYKVNIEVNDLATVLKKKGVRGIPYVLIFDRDGTDIIGCSGAFKKMDALKKNLDFIARAEDKKSLVLDPNGFVINRS